MEKTFEAKDLNTSGEIFLNNIVKFVEKTTKQLSVVKIN